MPVQTRRQRKLDSPEKAQVEKTLASKLSKDIRGEKAEKGGKSVILLLFCIVGIYICFLSWGLLQERVSTTPYGVESKKFKFFVFLNAIQALIASVVAIVYIRLKGEKLDPSPRPLTLEYIKISLFSCLASPFGYASLKYIDYPTLILGITALYTSN